MTTKRYYYSAPISTFLNSSDDEIIGQLTLASQHDINDKTSRSWLEEIQVLRYSLAAYSGCGSIYFEYNIPRMGRRADVILIIDGIIFILEFKTASQNFYREAITQVWDYALDLKSFHQGSSDRILVPILIAPNEKDEHCRLKLNRFEDDEVVRLLMGRTTV